MERGERHESSALAICVSGCQPSTDTEQFVADLIGREPWRLSQQKNGETADVGSGEAGPGADISKPASDQARVHRVAGLASHLTSAFSRWEGLGG